MILIRFYLLTVNLSIYIEYYIFFILTLNVIFHFNNFSKIIVDHYSYKNNYIVVNILQ